MIGDNREAEKNGNAISIAARDAFIIFVITVVSVLIAYPPFDIPIIEWLKNLYVPVLSAVLTAIVSYAKALGVKGAKK